MDVHLMGVVCVEAFRIFNLVFGKKSLYPTVFPVTVAAIGHTGYS
jgi:hypothetical protein